MTNLPDTPIGIDLFSGVGGMSLGFEKAGFNIIAAIDIDPIHAISYSINFPDTKTISTDIAKLNGQELRKDLNLEDRRIDVLFGGPPCQGFSLIGKRDPMDPRNELLIHFSRLINELKPDYFVVENVKGLLFGDAKSVLDKFVANVIEAGYYVLTPIKALDAADFGVPQKRERVFVLGCKSGLKPPRYPQSKTSKSTQSNPCVWDAIGDLPDISQFEYLINNDAFLGKLDGPSDYVKSLENELGNGNRNFINTSSGLTGCRRTIHTPETIKRFAETKPGTYESVSRFFRLTKEGLSPTLRAGTDKSLGSFMAPRPIHPIYSRCISTREAARIHSFPDWFSFHQTKWHGFRQIGNSVPPLLAKSIAESIMKAIREDKEESK